VDEDEIESRRAAMADLADELVSQRAEDRVGERVRVLVEEVAGEGEATETVGRAAHQGPEVDGSVTLDLGHAGAVGTFLDAVVTETDGVDLRAVA
jgi:tRNA A37 methylthiotransferase MiaB